MSFVFKLPDIGEGIHEGEILKWFVAVGDEIEEDDPLCEVQNDKAVVEIPSPVEGTVVDIHVGEGEVAIVGDKLITFEAEGYESSEEEEVEEKTEESTEASEEKTAVKEENTETKEVEADKSAKQFVIAMPSVRKYARDND